MPSTREPSGRCNPDSGSPGDVPEAVGARPESRASMAANCLGLTPMGSVCLGASAGGGFRQCLCDLTQPIQILFRASHDGEHDELRSVVRVIGDHQRFEFWQLLGTGLEHHPPFFPRLHNSLPAVDGLHRSRDLGAGREPRLHGQSAQLHGQRSTGHGHPDGDEGSGALHFVSASACPPVGLSSKRYCIL
jgi:hypothetical protein